MRAAVNNAWLALDPGQVGAGIEESGERFAWGAELGGAEVEANAAGDGDIRSRQVMVPKDGDSGLH